ncbi:MAG: winged helix-turn-helix transcriptional regulator [Acidobacteriaceae bacterium]
MKKEKKEKHKKSRKKHALALSAPSAALHPPSTLPPNPPSSAQRHAAFDPRIQTLVRQIIERVADKWTMVVLEVLAQHSVVRFSRLAKLSGGVSQKMLTKTLRQMESDGLVQRTVLPVIPPHVEYQLTQLGHSLGQAFCGVWTWAEQNYDAVEQARATFRASSAATRNHRAHPAGHTQTAPAITTPGHPR